MRELGIACGVALRLAGLVRESTSYALARMLLRERNVPRPDIAAILPHASVATTAGTHCRPSERDLRRHRDRAIGEDGDGVECGTLTQELLNELGRDGWEVCACSTCYCELVLKRRINTP